jgi:PAS domain-containing protein
MEPDPIRTSAIVTFPREDAAFAAFVEATIQGLAPAERDDPAVVQRALRRWHSRAIVQRQDELAAFGMGHRAWYIYRDGQAGVRSEQDWWQAPDVATARLGEDEVFIDGDAAACALVDRPPGGLAGVPWRDLVPSASRDQDATWLFGGLQNAVPVQSVFDFPRADGSRRVIEYRTVWIPDERVYLCRWRELAVIDAESMHRLVGD